MKKLLIGLLVFGSLSSFAQDFICTTQFDSSKKISFVFRLTEKNEIYRGSVESKGFTREMGFSNSTISLTEAYRENGRFIRFAMCSNDQTGIVLSGNNAKNQEINIRICLDAFDNTFVLDGSRGVVIKHSTSYGSYEWPNDSRSSVWSDCRSF